MTYISSPFTIKYNTINYIKSQRRNGGKGIVLAALKLCPQALGDGVLLQLNFPRSTSVAPAQNVSSIVENHG